MKAKKRELAGRLAILTPNKREEKVLNEGGIRVESVLYDSSKDGLAQATYEFDRFLPANAVVTRVFSDELVALTSSGSATLQLKAGSTALTDAIAFDTGFANSQSQALASSATAIKLSSRSELKLTVAAADLTAGKVRFYVEYMLAND